MTTLIRWRGSVAALLFSAWLWAVLSAEKSLPADAEAKTVDLPADLAKIPSESMLVLSGRIADLWAGFVKPVRDKEVVDGASQQLEKLWGMPPEQVERWTLVILDPPPSRAEPLFFLHTTKPYDRAKVLARGKNVKEEKYKGQVLYTGDGDWGMYPIDGRSLVYGKPAALRELIDHPEPKTAGNLAAALRLAAGKHSAVFGLNIKALNDSVGNELPGEAEPFRPLLQAQTATILVDMGDEARAVVNLNFLSEKDVKAAVKPAQTALDLARAALDQGLTDLGKQKDTAQIVELLKHVQASLKSVKIEPQDKMLRASANLKLDTGTTRFALTKAIERVRESATRSQNHNNLKRLVLAMHTYADETRGRLPAHAIYSKDGKPLLSWRVLILPYLGQKALYNEFHLNEPWDSDHNKKLLATMPKVFAHPQDEKTLKEHTTYYQGFFGKGVFFEGKQGIRIPTDIPDGTVNTIMFVEASKAVPWTKPEDIPYDPDKPLPKLGLPGATDFSAAMCDGSVRLITPRTSQRTLRLAITRNDNIPLGPDF